MIDDLVAMVAGATLLSMQFGWQTGVGVTCLVYFLKSRS